MLSLHNHNIFFLIIGSPVGSMTGWRHPGGKAQGGLDTERKRVRYAVWSARAWQLACASNLCSFSRPEQLNNTSLAAPTVQHAVTLIQTLYAKKLLLQYEATYTPTQRNVLSVLHVGVVGELGVTPVALTHSHRINASRRSDQWSRTLKFPNPEFWEQSPHENCPWCSLLSYLQNENESDLYW